ncbi:hypothetical protein HRbin40_01670 [bacterium HR40]|nr:hypothetical protein HRbin40_01670 [bacterium HR40]
MELAPDILRYGTAEPAEPGETLLVGPLSFTLSATAVRGLAWRGHELLRGIDFVVRDEHWGTYRPQLRLLARRIERDRLQLRLAGEVAEGALAFILEIAASATGELHCRAEAMAQRDFRTNRTGFVVLHPVHEVAGAPVTIAHADGAIERSHFPELVAPHQPFLAIAGIRHEPVPGLVVDCRFAGEVFEMEDQRNWTDASFKTYCRPLAWPFPFTIGAGERVGQAVTVAVDGDAPARPVRAAPTVRSGPRTAETVPAIALALEAGWTAPEPAIPALRALSASSLLARVDLSNDAETALAAAATTAKALGLPLELELVTPDDADLDGLLGEVSRRVRAASLPLRSVVALPAAYLESYQPFGQWPQGASPEVATAAARRAFPGIPVGSGMLTNFAEFNRRPPRPPFDFATHATCAIVHAADDRSVVETLECLPHVFRSARARIGQAGYRLGLVAIGARSNPYGTRTVDNPRQLRIPMAHVDPRQRGLFAAAFAVAATARTAGFAIDRLALAAPCGPFGCIYRRAPWPQPGYDALAASRDVLVFPLYHALRWLARAAGKTRMAVDVDEPGRIAALAFADDAGLSLLLAHLGACRTTVRLPGLRGTARILDEHSALAAICDPDWSVTAAAVPFAQELDLAPWAVARLSVQATA